MRVPFLLCSLLCPGLVWAAPPSKPPEVFDLKQLKPGMEMTGESVFGLEGLTPFTGTVIAVMPDFLAPHEDLILARLTGPAMDRYGVVNGMSGSPMYINGKLVGAVSYRFGSFPKEAICGITPAESMLALVKERKERPRKMARATPRHADTYGDATPIESPLICGGCAQEALDAFAPKLRESGLFPVRGGSGAPSGTRFPMFPGGPVGAALVEGDVNSTALGTITYMNGDDVVAFGHQFEALGDVEIPMTSAEVFSTVPSLSGGYKLGRTGGVVGALTDDRLTAISGRMGLKARTVPFTVTIDREGDLDAQKVVRFSIVDDLGMGAGLTDTSVASAILRRTGGETIGTVHLKGTVTLMDGTVIPMEEKFSAVPARNPAIAASQHVGDVMEALWRNAFERVQFKSVDLHVRQDLESQIGMIVKTTVDQPRIRAGETLKVQVDIRTHRLGNRMVNVEIPTEATMEPGYYWVAVADSDEAFDLDRDAALLPYPQNLKGLIKQLQQRRRGDRLYVYLLDKVKGARINGAPVAELPPSMLAILNDGMEGAPVRKLGKRALKVMTVDPGIMIMGTSETQILVSAPRGQ